MRKYKVYYTSYSGYGKFYTLIEAKNRSEVRAYFKKFYAAKITSIKLL